MAVPDRERLLLQFCMSGDIVNVESLLKNNVDVNYQDQQDMLGKSPLIAASAMGKVDIIRMLCMYGAQVDLQDYLGESALMYASRNGYNEAVKVLVDLGARVDLQDNDGESALMIACTNGHRETIKVLVELGAQVDLRDNDGESALMYASENGHIECVRVLLQQGAQVNLRSELGSTAMDLANHHGHQNITKLLLENSAEEGVAKPVESYESSNVETLPNREADTVTQQTPTLKKAFRRLLPISAQWRNIGVLLDIEDGILQRIEYDRLRMANDCLREMIQEWLKQTNPCPSWEILAVAVEPFDPSKAEEIRMMM